MKVAVIMGSLSDLNKVEPMIEILKNFGVEVDVKCLSAHRAHEKLVEFVKEADANNVEVIIAAAGMAAHLAGVLAAKTTLPVIGIPCKSAQLDGMDALLATVMMPTGIPVACVAIDGAKNAGYLALEILGIKYPSIKEKLIEERKNMEKQALLANEELQNKF